MQNEIYTVLGQLGIILLVALAGATVAPRSFRPGWLLAALVLYVFYDALLTRGFFLLPNLPAGSSWNWTGKIIATGGLLLLALSPLFGPRKVGLTLSQDKGLYAPAVVTAVLGGVFTTLAIVDGNGPSDLETIVFQWTMPGLDEELFYRGLLLLALNEAFTGRTNVLGAPIGFGGLLTSVLFGLVHAFGYGDVGFSFDAMTFAITALPSLILLWLRERTGSLVFPILAHNMANGVFTLI